MQELAGVYMKDGCVCGGGGGRGGEAFIWGGIAITYIPWHLYIKHSNTLPAMSHGRL